MIQYFCLLQFPLIKWSFFENSTTHNMPYVYPRLDYILELCQTFPIGFTIWMENGVGHQKPAGLKIHCFSTKGIKL